jgi:hypothetical protein
VVAVSYLSGFDIYKHFDRQLTKKTMWILSCMPSRLRAIHTFNGPGISLTSMTLPVLKAVMSRDARLRVYSHSGSSSEIFDQVEPFGFTRSHVSCIFGGLVEHDILLQTWLDERKNIEREVNAGVGEGE